MKFLISGKPNLSVFGPGGCYVLLSKLTQAPLLLAAWLRGIVCPRNASTTKKKGVCCLIKGSLKKMFSIEI